MLNFKRDLRYDTNKESLTLRRIHHSDVVSVLASREEQASRDRNWFLIPEAALLLDTVIRITDPMLCLSRLKLIKSNCQIYDFALPRLFVNSGRHELGASFNLGADFAIKVVPCNCCQTEKDFETESAALSQVSVEYNRLQLEQNDEDEDDAVRHYAYGSCSAAAFPATIKPSKAAIAIAAKMAAAEAAAKWTSPVKKRSSKRISDNAIALLTKESSDLTVKERRSRQKFLKKENQCISQLTKDFDKKKALPFWCMGNWHQVALPFDSPAEWLNAAFLLTKVRSPDPRGGCIVMQHGERFKLGPALTLEQWWRSVSFCLRVGAVAGWLHTDIRPENVLVFTQKGHRHIMLIDYGYAVRITSTNRDGYPCGLTKFELGDRYNCRGERLLSARESDWVEWTAVDDVEMAVRTMLEKLSRI